jgi:hypothetical protein
MNLTKYGIETHSTWYINGDGSNMWEHTLEEFMNKTKDLYYL